MDDITYQTLTEMIGNLTLQNKQLKRANTQLKKDKKRLGRVIKSLKDEVAKDRKPHYKNGRRGSKFNG
jgi:uncharacterized coiled-coil protein SlyX